MSINHVFIHVHTGIHSPHIYTLLFSCTLAADMSWFYYKLLFISLGVSVGLFLAYQGYKFFLSKRKIVVVKPRIILHSLEHRFNSGEILFHFELEKAQKIVFEICNENFESILILLEKELAEGAHTQIFQTAELPKGLYFYRLKGDEQQVMKKFAINNEVY